MRILKRYKLAQSILEYAVLVGVAGIALGAMQLYFRRGIQAAIKVSVDPMYGTQKDSEETDPEKGTKTSSSVKTTVGSAVASKPYTIRKIISLGGQREMLYNKKTNTSGSATYESKK